MSEYSTDELVEEITIAFEARTESIDDGYAKSGDGRLTKMAPSVKERTQRMKSIIIARLRAADVDKMKADTLFHCAKDYLSVVTYAGMIALRKAIADYQGKS